MKQVFVALLLAGSLLAGVVEHKVVYSLTTGSLKSFKMRLVEGTADLTQYYAKRGEKLKSVVIVHGDSYRFFLKDLTSSPFYDDIALQEAQAELHKALADLVKNYDIRFEVCSIGMKMRGIKKANLYPFVHPIYSARTGLIEWQNKGYAFVPIP